MLPPAMKFQIIFLKDTIFTWCHKSTTVITYKLHVSTGRRCQTRDCCPPARSLGKCPHCDRRVWSHLPWSWGWHTTLRCHHRSPLGWMSSGRHPKKQPSVRGNGICTRFLCSGAGARPGCCLRNKSALAPFQSWEDMSVGDRIPVRICNRLVAQLG